jgi:hypothetical protein
MSTKTKSASRVVTGVDAVQVYVRDTDRKGDPIVRSHAVFHGEQLPDTMIEGELERVEAMGVFDEQTPRERRIAHRRKLRKAEDALRAERMGEAEPPPDTPAERRGEVADVTKGRGRL